MGTMQWYQAAQAAIDGIRSTGSGQTIMINGNGYSSPVSWADNWYDTAPTKISNAVGWLTLTDPKHNIVASVHVYADQNAGGGADDIVNVNIYPQRLATVVNWARTNGIKVHLSEYGVNAANPLAQATMINLLNYLKANADVFVGSSAWAYGPPAWWSGYRFTMCPKNNYTVDDVKMTWLTPYFTTLSAAGLCAYE
jgi:endoglucanase